MGQALQFANREALLLDNPLLHLIPLGAAPRQHGRPRGISLPEAEAQEGIGSDQHLLLLGRQRRQEIVPCMGSIMNIISVSPTANQTPYWRANLLSLMLAGAAWDLGTDLRSRCGLLMQLESMSLLPDALP